MIINNKLSNTIGFISTKVTDLLGHHDATDSFKLKDSHQANILYLLQITFAAYLQQNYSTSQLGF